MAIDINGQTVHTMPISMDNPKNPSTKGIHVVIDATRPRVMDSTTFGLAPDAGGYIAKVQ